MADLYALAMFCYGMAGLFFGFTLGALFTLWVTRK